METKNSPNAGRFHSEKGGAATASAARAKYRVMKRLGENHVQVMILP